MYRRCRNLWTYNSLNVESSVHETKWAAREDGTIEFCFRTFTVKISVISQNRVIKSFGGVTKCKTPLKKRIPMSVCAFFISTWGHSTGILFGKTSPSVLRKFYGSSTKAYTLFLPRMDSREEANGGGKNTRRKATQDVNGKRTLVFRILSTLIKKKLYHEKKKNPEKSLWNV